MNRLLASFKPRCFSLRSQVLVQGSKYSTDASNPNSSPNGSPNPTNPTNPTNELEAKVAQLQDSYLRCLADMENLRTRTRKEVDSASTFAIQKFCKDIVGVADVLELALGSVKGDPRTAALLAGTPGPLEDQSDARSDAVDTSAAAQLSREELLHRLKDLAVGLSMTLSELMSVFSKHGLTAVDPIHQRFDPNYHMALYEVPSGEHEEGTVLAVQKKGYILHQRVIRPASVGVSKKP